MSRKAKKCTACGDVHRDHSAVHFSWIEDELGGLCLPDHLDHYPEKGDLLVTNDIRKVTCEACKKYYRRLNDLSKAFPKAVADGGNSMQPAPQSGLPEKEKPL